jgi:phosphatidylglycerophosphate synthase
VRPVRTGPVVGLVAQLALLAALAGTVGLSGSGWVVGVSCALTIATALAVGLARHGAHELGPADRVTLVRATIAGGTAALVTDSIGRSAPVTVLVALAVVALALDAIDGWIARRTRTASMFGARFDMEVDAFLILVLSLYVARSTGAWVLTIGAARYAFVAAGWLLPWLRGTLAPRAWCKIVAATQGIVLTIAVAAVLPDVVTAAALALSLVLLAESFGREVWGLWCQRTVDPAQRPTGIDEPVFVTAGVARGAETSPTAGRARAAAVPGGEP